MDLVHSLISVEASVISATSVVKIGFEKFVNCERTLTSS